MEPSEPDPSVKPPEKVWTKYDSNYTLPRPEGDIWANCLKPLQEEDEKQCKAWRDEVQNLLIFAGLFSAVVTTFVVDSYKNLQPSPDQRTVDLLSQIITHLDNSSTSFNPSSSSSSSFHASSSSIRVNTLWFMSLVISLTTVLVGIVSLQWIREYEYYSGHWTPKQIFEIRNMRHESMKKWFVPQIFTGLPLLLQTALVLFFIGLMDFLLHVYPSTAIPTIIIVSTTLIFLVLTTILPTLQYHTTDRFKHLDIPATPLPYKSPQSWVMLSTSKLIGKALEFCRRWVTYWIYGFDDTIWTYPKISNWNAFDWEWLHMRSQQVSGYPDRDRSHHYDTAHGVADFITKYCQSNKFLALSAYHCFLEQHNTNWNVVYRWSPQSQSHFYKSLKPPEGHISFIDCDLAQSSLQDSESLRQDTSMRIFLGIFNTHSSRIPGIPAMIIRQRMELLIRMGRHLGVSDLLDSALASELQWLYPKLVYGAVTTDESVLWKPAAVGIAEVIAGMDLCLTPSLADHRERIKYIHIKLATRILESGTDCDARPSGFAHSMGYAFVEHIFYGLDGRGSLPGWSEEYKESLAFLTHAIYRSMDKHPETDHDLLITSRMRDFLSTNPLAELRDRIPKWCPLTRKKFDRLCAEPSCDPWRSNVFASPSSLPPEIPLTDKPGLDNIPDLDNTMISPMTSSKIILPPQTPSSSTNMEPADEPHT